MRDELPHIATVEELVKVVELRALRTFEISGLRVEPRSEEPTEESDAEIAVNESHSLDQIESRFRATVKANEADFAIEVGLLWALDFEATISAEAIQSFLARVAVMAAYPFIREGIATTAARMELPVPLLGLLKQGNVTFTRPIE